VALRSLAASIVALALCSAPACAGSHRWMRVSLTYDAGGLPSRLSPSRSPACDFHDGIELRPMHATLTPFERSFVVRIAKVFLDPVPVLAFSRVQVRFKILLE